MPDSSEKVQKALNQLRRLPDNKICPNCLNEDPGAGFSAICMTFKTFICSDCKSAHQSFSHRVKHSSQSTWTMEEVKALDEKNGGGNRLAKEQWMATLPEDERPAQGALEAIKRFVEKVYIDERWKSNEPPQQHCQETKHKDKEKRRDRYNSGDATTASESRSNSDAPKSKHRSHKRRDAAGWAAADFGMYSGSNENIFAAGDGWGGQVASAGTDGSYGYPYAEPFAQQPLSSGHPVWGSERSAGSRDHPRSQGCLIGAARPMDCYDQLPHQAQAFSFTQQHTPFNSPPLNHVNAYAAHCHGQSRFPPHGAGLEGLNPLAAPLGTAGSSASRPPSVPPAIPGSANNWMASIRPAVQPPAAPQAVLLGGAAAGKEPVTLHPTNPWAEDLGAAKLITIGPTNPWADVVAKSFSCQDVGAKSFSCQKLCIGTSPRSLPARGPGTSTRTCGSQHSPRAQQANQWVY